MEIAKMSVTVNLHPVGEDRSIVLINQLSRIVRENWGVIFIGASRLGCAIESDYYAPERVQIGRTRLHYNIGVKYANGWKYSNAVGPSDCDIMETIEAIQTCIDAGAEVVGTNLTLSVG